MADWSGARKGARAGAALLACFGVALAGAFLADQALCARVRGPARAAPTADPTALMAAWFNRRSPPGTPAPDFTLPDVRDGRPVRLANLLGPRPVVLLLSGFG